MSRYDPFNRQDGDIPLRARHLRFGTFELHRRHGELRKRGLRIALQEQPLRILMALLERPGDVVGRETCVNGSGRTGRSSISSTA